MNWFTKLFKHEDITPPLVSFTVEKNPECESTLTHADEEYKVGLHLHDAPGFRDFLRGNEIKLDVADYSDQELAHMYVYQYCQKWLAANLKKPMFVETHGFPTHGEIRYDRAWNAAFVGTVTTMGFDVLPATEEELVDMYMNYVYGTRMMEELEAMEAANPASVAHPELSDPNNRFKG